MSKFELNWETTAAGTRYAFVDTDAGTTTLIVGNYAYSMTLSNDGYGGGFDAEVAGYSLGGQGNGSCEVWLTDQGSVDWESASEVEVLKKGTDEECWDWVIDTLAGVKH